jgi:hypothetical protein
MPGAGVMGPGACLAGRGCYLVNFPVKRGCSRLLTQYGSWQMWCGNSRRSRGWATRWVVVVGLSVVGL